MAALTHIKASLENGTRLPGRYGPERMDSD